MELKRIIQILKHWFWLLVLGFVAGAGAGVLVTFLQSPVYQATTKVLVFSSSSQATWDVAYLSSYQLVQTFSEFLITQPVLDAVNERLEYDIDPENIRIELLNDTQIVQIKVEDSDPIRCTDIANTLVKSAISQFTSLQSRPYIAREESIQSQLNFIEEQISSLQAQITEASATRLNAQIEQLQAQIAPLREEVSLLRQEIAVLSPPYNSSAKSKIAENQARLDEIEPILSLYEETYANLVVLQEPIATGSGEDFRLKYMETTLASYQEIYINLSNNLESVRQLQLQNASNVVQIEPARIPEKPVRPILFLYAALSAAVGMILFVGVAFLLEFMDETLRTTEQVKQALELPVLGYIGVIKKQPGEEHEILTARDLGSPAAEAFRYLRTNLEMTSSYRSLKSILVTSPGQFDGKSTVSVNMAVAFAQAGKKVLLVDADLRRPRLHQLLNISNNSGLSTILEGENIPKGAIQDWKKVKNLWILTSGKIPENPVGLLGSKRMDQTLAYLNQEFDLLILDTPPTMFSDSIMLSTKVDGVLLVIQPGQTRVDTAKLAIEQFKRIESQVVGVVLNKVAANGNNGYPNYAHYYKGYRSLESEKGFYRKIKSLWKKKEE